MYLNINSTILVRDLFMPIADWYMKNSKHVDVIKRKTLTSYTVTRDIVILIKQKDISEDLGELSPPLQNILIVCYFSFAKFRNSIFNFEIFYFKKFLFGSK